MLQKEQEGEQEKQPNVKREYLNVDSGPYGIFIFAINSPVTKQKYTYRLTKFFDFINIEGESIQQTILGIDVKRSVFLDIHHNFSFPHYLDF
jgi:hypothetical protein